MSKPRVQALCVEVADTWVNVPRVRVADTKEGRDAPRVQEDGTRDGLTSGTGGWYI
jgi:hypothetical protein